MCKLCDEGKPQDHTTSLGRSRRDFLKASTAAAVCRGGAELLSAAPAAASPTEHAPADDVAGTGAATSFAAGP